jgi:hypothetical protein
MVGKGPIELSGLHVARTDHVADAMVGNFQFSQMTSPAYRYRRSNFS